MRGFRVGSVLGFEIRIDVSWFVVFFLILWSLRAGFFPASVPGLTGGAYLGMALAGTLLFFASLLAHELSHSVVARARGIPVEGITLFIFGGVARTRMEAESPGDELVIAGVGPLMSAALAVLFLGLAAAAEVLGWGAAARSVAAWLALVNGLLAAFNLLPGFPLDGGRLFRALVWKVTGDRTRATRWATAGGRGIGLALIVLGFLQIFAGAAMGGLWLVFIGWFLRNAADMSFRDHLLRELLAGVTVRDIMSPHPETVAPDLTVQELVDEHLLRHRYQAFPVVAHGSPLGLVTLEHVKTLPRNAWSTTTVDRIMQSLDALSVAGDEPVTEALTRMRSSGTGRVLVLRDGRLEGIASQSDVARWVARAQDLDPVVGAPARVPVGAG